MIPPEQGRDVQRRARRCDPIQATRSVTDGCDCSPDNRLVIPDGGWLGQFGIMANRTSSLTYCELNGMLRDVDLDHVNTKVGVNSQVSWPFGVILTRRCRFDASSGGILR